MKRAGGKNAVVIDGSHVSLNDIVGVVRDGVQVKISESSRFVQRIEKTRKMLMKAMRDGVAVYGVNTGYGRSCGRRISMDIALKNGMNIFRFHGSSETQSE